MCDSDFLKKQIITYMGNKRKLLHHIENVLIEIQESMPDKGLVLGDGFSGSGVVSRLFKKHGVCVYSNDIAASRNKPRCRLPIFFSEILRE